MSITARPRRSVLYMPGANTRALEKAKTLAADCVILDLEDAVAPEAKDEARENICGAVKEGGYGPREVVIRINGLDTPWGKADLKAAAATEADAILAPKVSSAKDIKALDKALDKAGAPKDLQLWVMIETPLALLNIKKIAAAQKKSRLTTFVMGTNDLAKETNCALAGNRAPFTFALSATIAAAKAFGLNTIDGVFNDIKDEAGFRAECEQGRDFGFDGKTLIHPSQLAPCNEVFSPDAEAVSHAKDVIKAFADPENAGQGVLKINGKMTELLHRDQAAKLVQIAEAIAAFETQMET